MDCESFQNNHDTVIALVSSMCIHGASQQAAKQTKGFFLLQASGSLNVEIVDGSDPSEKQLRNELFAIAQSPKACYPLFFLKTQFSTTFLGDFDTVESLNEMGKLTKEHLFCSQEESKEEEEEGTQGGGRVSSTLPKTVVDGINDEEEEWFTEREGIIPCRNELQEANEYSTSDSLSLAKDGMNILPQNEQPSKASLNQSYYNLDDWISDTEPDDEDDESNTIVPGALNPCDNQEGAAFLPLIRGFSKDEWSSDDDSDDREEEQEEEAEGEEFDNEVTTGVNGQIRSGSMKESDINVVSDNKSNKTQEIEAEIEESSSMVSSVPSLENQATGGHCSPSSVNDELQQLKEENLRLRQELLVEVAHRQRLEEIELQMMEQIQTLHNTAREQSAGLKKHAENAMNCKTCQGLVHCLECHPPVEQASAYTTLIKRSTRKREKASSNSGGESILSPKTQPKAKRKNTQSSPKKKTKPVPAIPLIMESNGLKENSLFVGGESPIQTHIKRKNTSKKKKKNICDTKGLSNINVMEYEVNYAGGDSDPLYDIVKRNETKVQKVTAEERAGRNKSRRPKQ